VSAHFHQGYAHEACYYCGKSVGAHYGIEDGVDRGHIATTPTAKKAKVREGSGASTGVRCIRCKKVKR
jgi:hypothetical protein